MMRQGNGYNENKWELIDLSNSSVPNCPLPDYPFPISYPAAIMFDDEAGVVRACGGYIPSKEEERGGQEIPTPTGASPLTGSSGRSICRLARRDTPVHTRSMYLT